MAEGGMTIKSSKKGPSKVATPGIRPSYVLGSRPANLRMNPPVARIKPMQGQTDYGKIASNPAGASAGPMGQNPYGGA